jgi:hypothetical protein
VDASLLVASVLIGAAAYRAWRIIALDQITDPIRVWLIRREGRFWEFVGDLIGCVFCLGFWMAGIGAILVSFGRWSVIETVVVWAAASAVAGLLGEVDGLLTRQSESSGL